MSRVLTNEQNYYDIADTIRQMKNVNTTYKPREMASALKDIYSNEVEGTLPLSFEANGNNLLNYRIDGASGGVGDRTGNLVDKTKFIYGYRLGATGALYTTPSEQNLFAVSGFIKVNANEQYIISQRSSIGGYARRIAFYREEEESTWISNNDDSDLSFTVPNEALYLRFTTIQSVVDNIMLSKGTSLPDTYEPYGYKVPVVVSGKNLFNGELLQGYYTDSTMSTLASKNSNYKSIKIYLKKGKYTLSSNINLLIVRFITSQVYQSNPSGSNLTKTFTFEIENDGYISLAFRNENNQTWDNSTNLQIEIGDTATTCEEYTSPTITIIYLDTLIYENESISLSDTNVNIPTIRGTNVLTVDTTVQPSNVYIQAPKDSIEATQIANRLEVI